MRKEVLRSYRLLLRTCQGVFLEDRRAYNIFRAKAREEFMKNRHEVDKDKVAKLISDAREAEMFLRERVVQAVPTGDKTFRLRLTDDKTLGNNPKVPKMDPS